MLTLALKYEQGLAPFTGNCSTFELVTFHKFQTKEKEGTLVIYLTPTAGFPLILSGFLLTPEAVL